jgi:glycosyltransferase involved in cell wall biosynthesis
VKLVVVSHSFAAPINQQFYAEVERQTGWDLILIQPSNWVDEYGRAKMVGRWPGLKASIIAMPVIFPGNIILHAYRSTLAGLFREIQPDVIYVHHEAYASATAQVYLANALSVRRPIGFYSFQNLLKRYPLPFRLAEQWVYRESDFSFAATRDIEHVLRSKGYSGNVALLPPGFDPQTYYPNHPGAAELRAELLGKLPPDTVLLGYVGRIVPEKGLLTLLNACARIHQFPWHLVMVGDGPWAAQFDEEARSLNLSDRITRRGFIPHEKVPALYCALDLLVLPSETQPNWKEQFGRVIIESLACGTPVVGSNSGEIPNILSATEGGFIFSERQPESLAEQLTLAITQPERRKMAAETGKVRANELFANPSLAARFQKSILAAVNRNSKNTNGKRRFALPQ